jgi:hypothetical protein
MLRTAGRRHKTTTAGTGRQRLQRVAAVAVIGVAASAMTVITATSANADSIYFSSSVHYVPDHNLDIWDIAARAVPSKNLLGYLHWAEGGSLLVLDEQKDGLFVRGEIDYADRDVPGRRHHVEVKDPDGSGPKAGLGSYDVGYGAPVKARICVESLGCSQWYELRPQRPGR